MCNRLDCGLPFHGIFRPILHCRWSIPLCPLHLSSVKSIPALILVALLVLPYPLAQFGLRLEKYRIRKQVKRELMQNIPREELMTLSFPIAEVDHLVRWEHSREFEYRGEMFDIVSTQFVGDSVHYLVWWDHEETALNLKLDRLANLAMQNEADKTVRNRLQTLVYDFRVPCIVPLPPEDARLPHQFSHITQKYTAHVEPVTPPPRLT